LPSCTPPRAHLGTFFDSLAPPKRGEISSKKFESPQIQRRDLAHTRNPLLPLLGVRAGFLFSHCNSSHAEGLSQKRGATISEVPQPANPHLRHHTQLLRHVKIRLQTQISLLRRSQVVGIQSRPQIMIIQTSLGIARRRLDDRLQQTQRQISCLRDRGRLRVLCRWKNCALPYRASAATAALGRLRPAHRRARADDTINRCTQASTAHRRHSGYRIHAPNLPQSALFASGCNDHKLPLTCCAGLSRRSRAKTEALRRRVIILILAVFRETSPIGLIRSKKKKKMQKSCSFLSLSVPLCHFCDFARFISGSNIPAFTPFSLPIPIFQRSWNRPELCAPHSALVSLIPSFPASSCARGI
jgi:hypothetical protein